jgi:protein O-mannosyl-transferase
MSRLGLGAFAPLALVGLILIAYAPTLDAEFVVWDDDDHIYENPYVIGTEGYWHAWKDWRNRLFYPATYTAFYVEWRLADGQPWLFHLNNVLLHVADALLLGVLGRVLGLGRAVAWTAAGLWALHPLEVQTVAWATERKNVLYVLFYLLALLAHARSVDEREQGRARFWLATLACVLLSLLAKPAGVIAPAALVLLHWALGARFDGRAVLRLFSYFAVALPMAAIHIAREEITPGAPFGTRILIAARAVWTYVGRFLWPVDLVPMYSRWPVEEQPLPSVIALVGLLAVAAVVVWRFRSIPRAATFALGLFAINIGPVVGIIWFPYLWYSLTADHLAYLPSAGLALLLAMAGGKVVTALRIPGRAAVAAVAVAWVALALATRAQTALWHDTETLWTGTLAVTPESLVAHKNLGFALLGEGRVEEAARHFEEVLRLRPEDPEALLNLGLVAAGEGDLDRAVELYTRTLAQSPENAQAWSNLGMVAAQRGDLEDAIAAYRQAIEIDPQDPAPRTNLGAALVDRGEIDAGLREHEAALRLAPRFVNAHYNLGIAHLRAGRPQQAAEHFGIANELAPDDVDTLYILGVALSRLGRHEEAAGLYRRLLTIEPEHADATNNLAASLLALGDPAQALPLFERALALAPDDPASYRILARVLARNGQPDRAVTVLEKGIANLPAPQPELAEQLTELRGAKTQ